MGPASALVQSALARGWGRSWGGPPPLQGCGRAREGEGKWQSFRSCNPAVWVLGAIGSAGRAGGVAPLLRVYAASHLTFQPLLTGAVFGQPGSAPTGVHPWQAPCHIAPARLVQAFLPPGHRSYRANPRFLFKTRYWHRPNKTLTPLSSRSICA